jgi:hypothetical protein
VPVIRPGPRSGVTAGTRGSNPSVDGLGDGGGGPLRAAPWPGETRRGAASHTRPPSSQVRIVTSVLPGRPEPVTQRPLARSKRRPCAVHVIVRPSTFPSSSKTPRCGQRFSTANTCRRVRITSTSIGGSESWTTRRPDRSSSSSEQTSTAASIPVCSRLSRLAGPRPSKLRMSPKAGVTICSSVVNGSMWPRVAEVVRKDARTRARPQRAALSSRGRHT